MNLPLPPAMLCNEDEGDRKTLILGQFCFVVKEVSVFRSFTQVKILIPHSENTPPPVKVLHSKPYFV